MNWISSSLGEILPLQYGKSLPASKRIEGNIPVYSSAGSTGTHNESLVSGPCLIVGRKGTVGSVYYEEHDCFPIDTAFYTTGTPGIDIRFGYYLLLHKRLSNYSQDSAVPGLNRDRYSEIPVLVPLLSEQRAIAEVLGALDDKIAANNRTIKIGESLSTALLQGIPPSIPLANIVSQRRKTVNPSNLDVEATAHFSLPAFDDKKRPVYCRPDEIKSNKVLIDFPSVLMSKLNPRFPRIWSILNLPDSPALASTEFVVLTPKEISVPLLWAILSQRRFSLELATKVSGTSGSHQRVKPEDMLSSAVIDPNSVGQEAIGLINETAELLLKLGNENHQLSVLRDALLPQLMSGKIRVRDAEAIVEDVL